MRGLVLSHMSGEGPKTELVKLPVCGSPLQTGGEGVPRSLGREARAVTGHEMH